MAAAAAIRAPELSAGAILLRPLSPRAESSFPPLQGYPVLQNEKATGGSIQDKPDIIEDKPNKAAPEKASSTVSEGHEEPNVPARSVARTEPALYPTQAGKPIFGLPIGHLWRNIDLVRAPRIICFVADVAFMSEQSAKRRPDVGL